MLLDKDKKYTPSLIYTFKSICNVE